MSREIKFRGKRLDNNKWVCGYYSFNPFLKRAEIYSFDDVRSYVYEVIPESVGQYTGLRDSKLTAEYPEGQEVYEGDIVRVLREDSFKPYIAEVYFSGGCYGTTWFHPIENRSIFKPIFDWDVEVIGNVFDNPDLISDKGE